MICRIRTLHFIKMYGRKTPTTSYTRSTASIHSTGRWFAIHLFIKVQIIILNLTIFFRSLSNLHSQKSSRSMKSVKIPWYQKPILHNNKYINVQRGAMLAALFSLVSKATICVIQQDNLKLMTWVLLQTLAIFTIVTAVFDLYCLSMAAPGSTHYGYYFISYEFVYVGNRHGKRYQICQWETLNIEKNVLFVF